jgi:hypothetical protein
MQYSNQNTGFDGWRDNAAANLAEKIAAETALVEARREWANDTEALNALRAELAEAKAYRLRETRRADNNLDEYNKLRAENDRQERLIQDYMMSEGAFPMAVARIVTAPDADDLERLGFIAFRKAQNGLHAHEGAAFASQFLAAIADVAKSKSAEVGS